MTTPSDLTLADSQASAASKISSALTGVLSPEDVDALIDSISLDIANAFGSGGAQGAEAMQESIFGN